MNITTKNYLLYLKYFFETNYAYYLKKGEFKKVFENYKNNIDTLTIETINICNANCPFCAYGKIEKTNDIMPMSLFRKIINEFVEIGQGDLKVKLTPTFGELLLDPHLIERFQYLKEKKIHHIQFFTNAIMLTKERARKILQLTGDNLSISVSWGGFDEETYKNTMGTDKFEKTLRNILDFIELRRELNHKKPYLDLSIRSAEEFNKGEIYQNFLEREKNKEITISKIDLFDNWGGVVSQDDLNTINLTMKKTPFKKGPCKLLYQIPIIHANGNVSACTCRDIGSTLFLGNLNNISLKEAFFSTKRDGLIQKQEDGIFPEVCQKCNTYVSIYNLSWIKNIL